jgi:hypothetical protein
MRTFGNIYKRLKDDSIIVLPAAGRLTTLTFNVKYSLCQLTNLSAEGGLNSLPVAGRLIFLAPQRYWIKSKIRSKIRNWGS